MEGVERGTYLEIRSLFSIPSHCNDPLTGSTTRERGCLLPADRLGDFPRHFGVKLGELCVQTIQPY